VPASHLLNESLSDSAGIPTNDKTLNLHLDSKDVGKAIGMVIQTTLCMKFYVMLCSEKLGYFSLFNANNLHLD
tara:strand:- start:665 stop:883 length:219 start_codon:yes stop_codon:yes gene_type:complete